MTMTSVAVAPGSLGAPPAMLTPTKSRYHLQPSLEHPPSSPSPIKNYDTLSKGKKSWSVRLGLSRQSHQGVDDSSGAGKGWGTISGGSALSRQMLYGDPWLYGTVRSSRGYLNPPPQPPPPPPPPGAPILVVCSCPEFLSGTTRKLGNCRKCGGHRLAGVPLGGTCRMATASSRSRPSLAGMLRTSLDDPYDVMRRSRLVEPRSRARSISPHRPTNQRDSRSQSVARSNKDRMKVGSTEVAVSRTEWFDNEPRLPLLVEQPETRRTIGGRVIRVVNKKGRKWHQQEQQANAPIGRQQENNVRRNKPDDQDWKDVQTLNNNNNSSNKNNNEDDDDDDNDNDNNNGNDNSSNNANKSNSSSDCVVSDSRKSILECDVNPYLLVKKQTLDEDDLSDDLSDNALELDDDKVSCSSRSLFDPSKVKSIERLANGISAVAAIGGQRIRVFNEPREISDEETAEPEQQSVTRIPIPKISPKRPPRRAKESRTTLKSILKRGKADGKRKNVLFNVNNVIFAPEKAAVAPPSTIAPSNPRISNARVPSISCTEQQHQSLVGPIVVKPNHQPERPKFITIPNIRDPPNRTRRLQEPRAVPQVKVIANVERTKIEESVIAKRPRVPVRNNSSRKDESSLLNDKERWTASDEGGPPSNEEITLPRNVVGEKNHPDNENSLPEPIRAEDETEFEIEIEELANQNSLSIPNEDEQLIHKSGDDNNGRRGCLSRSLSDRTSIRPETTAASVNYLDTMRLSLRRRARDENDNKSSEAIPEVASPEEESTKNEDEGASLLRLGEGTRRMDEHFRRMRPTSWSPPPGKVKHRDRASHNGGGGASEQISLRRQDDQDSTSECRLENWRDIGSSRKNPRWRNSCSFESCPRIVEVTANSRPERNVCKITVSPRAEAPLIHRLRINGNEAAATSGGATPRGTSIMINGDQNPIAESRNNNDNNDNNNNNNGSNGSNSSDNRVTISVGGEDSVCNPTVISVNSSEPPKIQTSPENRTLVILENYRSNIVLESPTTTTTTASRGEQDRPKDSSSEHFRLGDRHPRKREDPTAPPETSTGRNREKSGSGEDERAGNANIEPSGEWSNLSKESVISKLLEDSLRKARENGKILDVSSGEAILRILKQSLLKSKDYESSESTIEPDQASYSRSPSLNSDTDFVSTNLFLEENPYEVIKEPIYEEIPEEPPPLPLSPPPPVNTSAVSTTPTDDYIKDTIYFAQRYKEAYYKKVNAGQFLRSYLSDDVFKDPNDFKNDDDDDDDDDAASTATVNNLDHSYLSKSPQDFSKNIPSNGNDPNITSKFKLLNFLVDSKDASVAIEDDETEEEEDDEEEEEEEEEEDEDDDEEDEEDTEGDLEALYEQKETSMGDLSSKSSQISNVSDSSSEDCNIILTSSSSETLKSRTVDIERTDSGVGSESSQASSGRGISRRWRTGNVSSGPTSLLCEIPQVVVSGDSKLCEDCEQRLEPLITDSGVVYAPFVCRKCSKKRAERKEIITEIVETEQKYGRDLQIILEEFHRPMLRAGLLTQEQLAAIFLNVEELHEHNLVLAEKLKEAVEFSQVSGDEDLVTVDVGKIFLESERMLHAFESYCTRQGGASLLLQNLEKEKELLRIFLKVSQMENTVLRRMNLNSFLMVPVQRVTKYPLLLARLLKATPAVRIDVHEARKRLEQARANIELHLEHMNAEAKDVTSTKLWRRISIIQNGRRSNGEQDMVNIKLRKMAVEILEWAHEEARFVLEGRLLVAQPTDNNWRRGRTVKLAPVTAMLVTNGKPRTEFLDSSADLLFPRQIGIKEATLLLVKEKIGRYSLLREPLYLDKCIVCCETDLEDYFEIQELSSKETFIFKAEDGARTKRWCRTLQAHAQSLGAWRRRRGALPNIMICGVARS